MHHIIITSLCRLEESLYLGATCSSVVGTEETWCARPIIQSFHEDMKASVCINGELLEEIDV